MKILWLYGSNEEWDAINHWYHMDWAEVIKQQPGVELIAYGWNLEQTVWKNLAPITFNTSLDAKDLKKEFNFDVIIMDNKNRFFRNPRKKKTTGWLSDNFFDGMNNIPKIMIEGDYHQHKSQYLNENWFNKSKIDLLLHRHISNLERSKKEFPDVDCAWLPCSVDIKKFKPNNLITRIPKICFIGGWSPGLYTYRNIAGNALKSTELLQNYTKRLVGNDYINCLQSYVSHINCSSKYSITTAKMFEIMASGSVLFTDASEDYGLSELFPNNSYCTYKRDGSNVIEKAKFIINEPTYRDSATNKAVKCMQEKHTHEIRAKELIKIIEKKFNISESSLPLKLKMINKMCSIDEIQKILQIKQSNLPDTPIALSNNKLTIYELYNKISSLNIKFWLLKESCLEVMLHCKLPENQLTIGVETSEIRELIKNTIQDDRVIIFIEPNRFVKKMMRIHENGILVPKPVVEYLAKLYGNEIKMDIQ